MSETETLERVVVLTENAARRVKKLREMQGNERLLLRLQVSGGGCSGFSYGFALDDVVNGDDEVFDYYGVGLVIDPASLDLLAGSVVDFVEDLVGSSFQVKNPNATSTCGCGTSFAV